MKKYFLIIILCISSFSFISCIKNSKQMEKSQISYADSLKILRLNEKTASGFARLALKCIQKEYPNKLDHVMNNAEEVKSPNTLHPAFYGCFDWHSCVHGHWMLIHLLKLFPDLPEAKEIRKAINKNLTAQNLMVEVKYLDQPNRKSFERTYGWTWLLKLADELKSWNDPDGNMWSKNLQPLADAIVNNYLNFLPKQTYPIRTGVHPNTSFGIIFALDYAKDTGNKELQELLIERSKTYYLKDKNYPVSWEPGGEDFLSPALEEADLMRRVLSRGEFDKWFEDFLPGLSKGEDKNILEPAVVADRTDPKLVHLDGLNLSRAWCMSGIASELGSDNPIKQIMLEAAYNHAKDALSHVASGNYEGEHWLASFAVYLLSTIGNY